MVLRYLTAGESHGPALVGILEGLPAGVPVATAAVERELARRRMGYGRSPRMDFEEDRLEVLGGLRHGRTIGSPVGLIIHNSEWPKWTTAMAVDAPDDPAAVAASGRGTPLTRPRPGHADLAGMQKYDLDDARNVLERASARETATRVALAAFAKALLAQVGITVVSHVVAIGGVALPDDAPAPGPGDLDAVDGDPVRAFHPATSAAMQARIDEAKAARDTLGGVVEVLAYGVPPGLGSHVHWDRRLDTRLAAALMGIQAFKGVEVGGGFATAAAPGSRAHDEILPGLQRATSRAGGVEGGMSTGQPLWLRAAMKPLSSLTQPLRHGRHHHGARRRGDHAALRHVRRPARRRRVRGRGRAGPGRRAAGEDRRRHAGRGAAQPRRLPRHRGPPARHRPQGGGLTARVSSLLTPGRNLVLVGMMGAGKNTVGRLLAERLGRLLADTDTLVAERMGMPVAEAISTQGERAFRRVESEAVREVAAIRGQVVAVGGGAVLDPANVTALRGTGDLVWLDASGWELAERLAPDAVATRPLLRDASGPALAGRLEELAEQREEAYRSAATVRIATDGLTPAQVAETVLDWARSVPGLLTREELVS